MSVKIQIAIVWIICPYNIIGTDKAPCKYQRRIALHQQIRAFVIYTYSVFVYLIQAVNL